MTQFLYAGFDQAGTRAETAPASRILIIEDQLPICSMYSEALSSSNHRYNIQLTHSGENGVEAALKDRPHLVIMDLSLPGISGLEVAEKLKLVGIFPDIPLIIASAQAGEVTEQIQANAYLVKPFPMSKLVAAVQDALNLVFV